MKKVWAVSLLASALSCSALAGELSRSLETPAEQIPELKASPEWFTGRNVEFFGISPHLHIFNVVGTSTAPGGSLATDHHDPQRNGYTLQALEPGLSVRWGDHFRAFTTYSAYTDSAGNLDGEWEEYFVKLINLPAGFELRGGRFLNRFGFQNAVHNHSWFFVNQNLANGLLLQEGELTSIGGEITWNLPTPFVSALTVSGGGLPDHDDDHAHAHGETEPLFEPDGANFADYLVTANYAAKYDYNDFHQYSGTLSLAYGKNGFGRHTAAYGLGMEYLWRKNGYGPGGASFRWRNEFLVRNVAAISEMHGEHGDEHGHHEEEHEEEYGHHEDDEDGHGGDSRVSDAVTQFGFASTAIYGFDDQLEAGLRVGYVSGSADFGTSDRVRVSPAVTWYINRERTLQCRLQYDYDHLADSGGESSVWFQVGFNWGGSEVR